MKFRLLKLATTAAVAEMFDREVVTINQWRESLDLPFVKIEGDGRAAIRFDLKEVRQWAKANGKEFKDTGRLNVAKPQRTKARRKGRGRSNRAA